MGEDRDGWEEREAKEFFRGFLIAVLILTVGASATIGLVSAILHVYQH